MACFYCYHSNTRPTVHFSHFVFCLFVPLDVFGRTQGGRQLGKGQREEPENRGVSWNFHAGYSVLCWCSPKTDDTKFARQFFTGRFFPEIFPAESRFGFA